MPYFCSVQINYNMMYMKTIKILVVLCFCSGVAGQEANPLLNMFGNPYAEYHDTYVHLRVALYQVRAAVTWQEPPSASRRHQAFRLYNRYRQSIRLMSDKKVQNHSLERIKSLFVVSIVIVSGWRLLIVLDNHPQTLNSLFFRIQRKNVKNLFYCFSFLKEK